MHCVKQRLLLICNYMQSIAKCCTQLEWHYKLPIPVTSSCFSIISILRTAMVPTYTLGVNLKVKVNAMQFSFSFCHEFEK